jgi:hypothetical protein
MNPIDNIMELFENYQLAPTLEQRVYAHQTLRAAIEAALTPGEPDVAGAIENGRAYADRLESHYNFECEAGPLQLCSDWVEFRRCFEWLCEHVAAPQPQPCNPAEDGVCEALECCKDFKPDWDQAEALRDSLREHMAMIRADREAMRQALEQLEWADNAMPEGEPIQVANQKVITALRERLK